jgi:hypothetical protein
LHALIVNRARNQTLLTLAPVDAYRTASGLAYALPESRRLGVGAWMQLSSGALRLGPASRRLVAVSLHIPARFAAGTYAGAISIGLPQQSTAGHAEASIHVQVRLAVAVVVHVRAGRQA